MTTTFQDLQSILSACISDENLRLQVNQTGSHLSVVINRLNDTTVNYEDIAETLVAKLRSLNLSNVNTVKLYGRPSNSKQVEWQASRPLVIEGAKPAVSRANVINNASSQQFKSKFQGYLEQFSHYSNVISAASLLGLLLLLGFNTLAGQKTQATLWEYKIVAVPDRNFTETMDTIGADRWELVSARRAQDSETDRYAYECIFRRTKK